MDIMVATTVKNPTTRYGPAFVSNDAGAALLEPVADAEPEPEDFEPLPVTAASALPPAAVSVAAAAKIWLEE